MYDIRIHGRGGQGAVMAGGARTSEQRGVLQESSHA